MSISFEQTLRLSGLHPLEIKADGRRRRCPTEDKPHRKNGQYVLLDDGRTGFWRNFVEGMKWQVWRDDSQTEVKPVDPAVLKARRDQERAERIKHLQASRELWSSCDPYRVHPYIEHKGLSSQGCHGLRLWNGVIRLERTIGEGGDMRSLWEPVHDIWLAVPIYWRDRIVNVQRIGSTGIKRQMKGWVPGGHLVLNRPGAAVTILVEGLATGLAVFQAIRHARVVVCFFADNLLPVIQLIKPSGSVVIAADNDHRTQARRGFNPGREKAANAADLIGCGVVWPEGIEGTDFCDYLQEVGQGAARKVERLILSGAKYVEAPA